MKILKLFLLLLVGNALAQLQAYNFYFLPPPGDEWVLGTPYLVWEGHKEKLTSDNSRCGWYRYTFNGSVPGGDAWVWLNGNKATPDDKVGDKGLDEDPVAWIGGNPTPFNLATRFEDHHSLFFDPQESAETSRWSNTYSGKEGKCTYSFAAIIYHTSDSANKSFSMYGKCGNKPENGNTCRSAIRDGVTTGIVKKRLGANGKIEFESDQGTDWTEDNFKKAFESTPGTNVQRCFDMPFTRRGDAWEFDALYLCRNGDGVSYDGNCTTIGGFYPPSLTQNIDIYDDYTEQYAALPRLNNTDTDDDRRRRLYNGQKNVRPAACVNMWCFDRGWYGGTCGSTVNNRPTRPVPAANQTPAATVGDLSWVTSSTTKDEIDDYMKTICYEPFRSYPDNPNPSADAIVNNTVVARGDFVGTSIPMQEDSWGSSPKVSGLMCFESAPAQFTYQPGQEFFFRGDDDIWVFINNQLVVDVGGTHNPAPGYVKLDTIKTPKPLVPGEEYPINIFFCDRRNSGSNIRITTNMYFAQSSGLFVKENPTASPDKPAKVCMVQESGGSCNAISGGAGVEAAELCGRDIKDQVEYFLVNRRGDEDPNGTLWTPPNSHGSSCSLSGDILTCYGGLVIDLGNGTASVNKTPGAISGITGSWTLYARVKDKPEIERVKIASFSTQINVRMAWGPIIDYEGNTITGVCNYANRGSTSQESLEGKGYAVTGELFPVCFAVGEHGPGGRFEVNDEGAGSTFSISTSGFKNEFGNYNDNAGLKVYLDENGESPPIPFNEVTRQFTIPSSGVLVLWVTGGYEQKRGTYDYTININGRTTDEVTLHSILPRFQWIRASGTTDSIPVCSRTVRSGEGYGSKFDSRTGCPVRTADGKLDYVWVGEDVKLNLRAFNEKNNKTCKTCNFSLRLKANATPAIAETDGALINYPSLKITKGEASFAMQGRKQALITSTEPSEPKWITATIMGPESDYHTVVWDSLQFRKPPVPLPERSEIYDDDGDGVGDRMVIVYSRGFRRDSLPNMLEVKWDPDTTVLFGRGKKLEDGKYSNTDNSTNKEIGAADNITYWSQPEHLIKIGALNTSISGCSGYDVGSTLDGRGSSISANALELCVKDTIILHGKFSKKVLTQGDGKVTSWATFKVGTSAPSHTGLTGNIDEKIPAIITTARYEAGGDCGNTVASPCRDRIALEFSEPVKMDPTANNASDNDIKNPFAYKLIDLGGKDQPWDILKIGDLPTNSSIRFGNRTGIRPTEEGDATVTITFNRYRDGDSKSGTPMPGDSVKFAARFSPERYVFLNNILMDLKGNTPNPMEIGRQIEGRKPFNQEKIPIAELDPNYPDYVKDINDFLKENGSSGYDEDSLFIKDRPVELLPVPPDCNIDCVRKEYPGTIGILLSPDISNAVSELEARYPGTKISDADIVFYPKAFYHTNLGNYVADRGFSVKCNDAIFPHGDNGQPSCRAKKSQLYIAWDMKDFKGRFVGAGAYVGIYDFYWEINIPALGVTEKMENIEKRIEMHGVKRVKKR